VALARYGALKGRVLDFKDAGTRFHHVQLHVRADNDDYRVSVNVKSKLDHSRLEYHLNPDFDHPLTAKLEGLREGYTDLPRKPAGLALDYIRSNVLEPGRVRRLDFEVGGLNRELTALLHALQRDEEGLIVAFGEPWGPEAHPDNIFGFVPALGLHNVHMNQGNDPSYRDDDGVWQDGALFCLVGGRWQALFLKFQAQAWHTDDRKGHALEDDVTSQLRITGVRHVPDAPLEVRVKNFSGAPVNLSGWALANGVGCAADFYLRAP
jgi:uncharacterized protein YukJ